MEKTKLIVAFCAALFAGAAVADAVVTNKWVYHPIEAYSSGRWASYLYKDGWSLEAAPTADQIAEFGPGSESQGVKNSLTVLARTIATAESAGKERLGFWTDGFYAKGLVLHTTDASSDAWIENLYFSSYNDNFLKVYLGSEGLTMYGSGTAANTIVPISLYDAKPLTLTASQTWKIGTEKWKTMGTAGNWMTFACNLASDPDVTWRILGKSILRFQKGANIASTSEEFGGAVYANAGFMMDGASQVGRLGTNAVAITCETVDGQRAFPSLFFRLGDNDDTSWAPVAFTAPLALTATNPSIYDVGSAEITATAIAVESKNGQRTWVSFPKGISGTYSNKGFAFAGEQSGADGGGVFPGRRHSSHMRRDTARIILDGDNSLFVPQNATDRILLKTILYPAHANALGANNSAILEVKLPTLWGSDGVGMVGVIASNNVTIAGTIGTTGWFDGKYEGNNGIHPMAILGSEGPGTSRFAGDVNMVCNQFVEGTDGYYYSMNVTLTADRGGTAAFDGKVRAGRYVTVNGTGDVALNNGANVFSRALGLAVRSGRLIAGANGAVGNGPIKVGEAAARYTVRAVKTGRFPRDGTIVGNAVTISQDDGVTPTKIVFSKAQTIDGVTLAKGDRVLIASGDYCIGGTVLDGVFTVTSDDAKTWELDPAFDTAAGRLALYGARIHVTEGDLFAGRDFYWAEHLADRATKPTKLGSNKFAIYDDAAENPDTGLLAAGGVTLANAITVANDGTGRAEIGASSAGTAVFTGTVTVEKPTLEIYAPAGATVQIDGLVRNATGGNLTIVKTGAGDAVLNQLDKSVTDIRLVDGTLRFAYVDTEGEQPLLHLDAMNDASLTKVVETVGGHEVTSVTKWADTRGSSYPYVRSCRDMWTPRATPDPKTGWGWSYPRHAGDWHYLLATRHPVYTVTNETGKAGFDLPALDMLDAFNKFDDPVVTDPLVDLTNQSAVLDVIYNGTPIPYNQDSIFLHIREAFVVVKDNDGPNDRKMSLLGTRDSSNTEYYYRGATGALISSAAESSEVHTGEVKNGTNRLDGVVIEDVTTQMLPAGFHVVSFCPTGDTYVATLGMWHSKRAGGIQYGEVIVYTNALSKTEHDRVEAELLAKWLGKPLPGGDAPTTTEALTIGVAFKNGELTGSLDMGARFKPAQPCTVNVTCEDAVRVKLGEYLLVRAKSVETDGSGWTVNKVGFSDGRTYSVVRKTDGNLYLRVAARGLAIRLR